jgi:hypothetical protein
MKKEEKWEYIIKLDEEFLKGGVILSEWTIFLVKDAEMAFCNEANLAAILTCQAAIECHLRYELFEDARINFYELIGKSDYPEDLKNDLHKLRKFRNTWVHVREPDNDTHLLERPEYYENELEDMAKFSIETMLRTLYFCQSV